MTRYLTAYYILNAIAVLSYPIFRLYVHSYRLKEQDTFGYTRENGVICTSLALLYIKWKKSATMDQFLHSIFTIGKVAITVLFTVMNIKFGLYYAFACSLLFLFTRQPKYAGPSHMLSITSEEQFGDLVLKELKTGKKQVKSARNGESDFSQKNMWLVEFFLDWAETCVYTKPIWTEYSNKYTTQNLRFAEVNLATVPDLAKKYNINTTALSRQLPTLIMFEDGKEIIRFPPYDEKTKLYMKVVKYHKKEIAKYFDLEERYLATRFTDVPVKQKNGK